MQLSTFTSNKFRFWSFISMVLLVFVHGYNLDVRYMQPWTIPGQTLTFSSFTEYFLANGIFRFRIPMLFIISGFLYSMHDQNPNKVRIRKRLRTLLVPYLFWSAFGIALTLLLEMSITGRTMVAGSHVVQIDQTRQLLHDYRWYELTFRWLFSPIPYQLWFIRVLLIYNLAYPVIRWCVMHRVAKWIFFGVAFLLWLGTMGFTIFEGEGLLFFSLGIWIQKNDFNIEAPAKWLRPAMWGAIFVGLATIKTVIAFIGNQYLGNAIYPILTILHKSVVLSGLFACWFGFDMLVGWFMDRKWFVWLSAFSFMIYAMHAPMVAFLIDPALHILRNFHGAHMIAFVVLPVTMIIVIILFSAFLRKILPSVYGLLTGGRGTIV
jgi:fucose 4-O-acetylase-like acetyltransferase